MTRPHGYYDGSPLHVNYTLGGGRPLGTISHPSAAVLAMPRYQELQALAIVLAAQLRANSPRAFSDAARANVAAFQRAAGVVGANELPSGVYGPATFLALDFFLPASATTPNPWPGSRPGTWNQPDWTRDVAGPAVPGPERIVNVPGETVVVEKTPSWVWWLLSLGSIVAVGGALAWGVKSDSKKKRGKRRKPAKYRDHRRRGRARSHARDGRYAK